MRCIAAVGINCRTGSPQANGCASEYTEYGQCLATLLDAGGD
jgi:hypothetical protein